MSVTKDRKYTKQQIYNLLENAMGKTLGEIDNVASRQFERTIGNSKITGIAGDVVEQSLFRYARDSRQECDIEIDGALTELKTTGVRIPKSVANHVKGKNFEEYSKHFLAKEGISITGVTFTPTYEPIFETSHFHEKSERLLIVFYEYNSYSVVPASEYRHFRIVGYCYNRFTENELLKLKNDWEIVRDFIKSIYDNYKNQSDRNENLVGFTHILRPKLLLIELVPGFKKTKSGSFQRPRYRLKKSFVDSIVQGHFNKSRNEISLKESFSSFEELDYKCHNLTEIYRGKTLVELKNILNLEFQVSTKDFASRCVIRMFNANCGRLNQILDFTRCGIIAKTIIVSSKLKRTEDMKLTPINFEELTDRDVEFDESDIYTYFCEHSFLCPIFREDKSGNNELTTFEGFKRFAFDEEFIEEEVKRTWKDARNLIHQNKLIWEYEYDRNTGMPVKNKSGSYKGAPNLPKSSTHIIFFRGGANDSKDSSRTEIVNNIKMLPQFLWIKGQYMVEKLENLPFL